MTGERIGIVGLGLIGGSIALRARARGAWVTGFDLDPAATAQAMERAAVDRLEPSLDALAGNCDMLVIALPLAAAADALEELGSRAAPGPTLVIDVASVKAPLARFSGSLAGYIGTHPMAGRERAGLASADPELFENATWAHVPHANATLIARVRAFIGAMGARPLAIEALEHDTIVAATSHLPQAISIVLAAELAGQMHDDPRVIELCGPGMMSMLRLARSPAALWSAIFSANAVPLAARLRSLAGELAAAADGLDRGDSTQLMSYFEDARDAVDALAERFPTNSRS